jgi:hypothetical protein
MKLLQLPISIRLSSLMIETALDKRNSSDLNVQKILDKTDSSLVYLMNSVYIHC